METEKPDAPVAGPRHAPYAEGVTPFAIGVKPLDPARWLEVDERRAEEIALKRRLYAESPETYFAAEPGSEPAQREALRLVRAHLAEKGAPPPPDDPDLPPLLRAALQVQEDLLILTKDAESAPYRLVAASLSFPSSWSLAEKFGRPMHEIHDPVPGFGTGTRNAKVIDRMFASLRAEQLFERFGWSIYGDGALSHPILKLRGEAARRAASLEDKSAAILAAPHIRVERQTLRRAPETGALIFTIRIHVDPLALIEARPDGARLAAGLAEALAGMSEEAVAFKNLTLARPPLLERLRARAEAG